MSTKHYPQYRELLGTEASRHILQVKHPLGSMSEKDAVILVYSTRDELLCYAVYYPGPHNFHRVMLQTQLSDAVAFSDFCIQELNAGRDIKVEAYADFLNSRRAA